MARPEVPRRLAGIPPTDSLAQHSAGNPEAEPKVQATAGSPG